MTMLDAKTWFAAADLLLAELQGEPEELTWLDVTNVPRPPPTLEFTELVILKGSHEYDSWRTDVVSVLGDERAVGRLGLLILAELLHSPESGVRLTFPHPHSQIKAWQVQAAENAYAHAEQRSCGLQLAATGYGYQRGTAERHPWQARHHASLSLPRFALTNAERLIASDEEWVARDVLVGCGPIEASALFAQLLLDLSQPGQPQREVDLEGEGGFASLAPTSIEMQIWLPGSLGWRSPHR